MFQPEILEMAILSLKERLNFDITDNTILPIVFKHKILEDLNKVKDAGKQNLK